MRLKPIPEDELTPEEQAALDELGAGSTGNTAQTLIRHPEAQAALLNLGRVLRSGDLPARHREILILRTGWNSRSRYELAQHYETGSRLGMTEEDMARIRSGPEAAGWDPFEATLCRTADELHADGTLSDGTWQALAARYDDRQIIQAILLVGYYHMVALVLNALGVQLERGATPFPLQ